MSAPRWTVALLRQLAPSEEAADVLGDLEEAHRARVQRCGPRVGALLTGLEAVDMAVALVRGRIARQVSGGRAGRRPGGAEPTSPRRMERPGRRLGTRVSSLDFKLGARMLVKYPGLTLVGGFALTIAIGLSAVWFDAYKGIFHPDLPLSDGDRIVKIMEWSTRTRDPEFRSLHDFARWREGLRSIEDIGAYLSYERNLLSEGMQPGPVNVAEITASAFQAARVAPLLGRTLVAADQEQGALPVVVLGYDVWKSRFGADRGIIGRTVHLGHATATVVGVMPEGFFFPVNQQAWVPLSVNPANYGPREGPAVHVFGRLAPGATFEQAQAELTVLADRAAADSPKTHEQLVAVVLPYLGRLPGRGRSDWVLFLANLGILALLAMLCANVATLAYARAAMRESEIALRYALGASRGRIVTQLFIEALVLALAAAVVGLVFAHLGLEWSFSKSLAGGDVPPFWRSPGLEAGTIVYVGGLAVFSAVVIGLIPAIRVTGSKLHGTLQNFAAGGSTVRFGRIWTAVIVMQIGFTVAAIPFGIGAGYESIRDRITRAAFPAEAYATLRLEMDRGEATSPGGVAADSAFQARFNAAYEEMKRRLAKEPGVAGVAYTDVLPGTDPRERRMELEVSGSSTPRLLSPAPRAALVGPDFFETFQMRILSGRGFSRRDARLGGTRVVVVNEAFVRQYLGGGNPIGRRIRYAARSEQEADQGRDRWYEITGVVQDLGLTPTNLGEAPFVYQPASPAGICPPYVAVHVRGMDGARLLPRLRTIAAEVDLSLRLYDVLPFDQVVRQAETEGITFSSIVLAVILFTLILAVAGIYSLMSVSVARRQREIAIRSAIGASPSQLLTTICSRAAFQVGGGVVAGILVNILVVVTALGGWRNADLLRIAAASSIVFISGMVACVGPARRALRIRHAEALRSGG